MLVALTRAVSSAIADCELTHVRRVPIDVARAREQHREYEAALVEAGCRVERIDSGADMPDAVFIEDAAVVFDEVAIVTRPGAESRRKETDGVASALERYRPLRLIESPGTLDGGDVLIVGRHVYLGKSSRTNQDGRDQVRRILDPLGYTIVEVQISGCLHLKSAVTGLGDNILLVNPTWVTPELFGSCELVEIDPQEPYAANALLIGSSVIFPASFPRTWERLALRGVQLRTIDASELQKAEGALTCCSLIFKV